jgi:hypothetical protein
MEILEPGHIARVATQNADAADRRRQEEVWFQALVKLQEAGRVDEAAAQAVADMEAQRLRFVLEPLESIAMLYAREVDRLLALDDVEGARRAESEAMRYMGAWASWSTSGGEGTARSRAGDRMQSELEARFQRHNPGN